MIMNSRLIKILFSCAVGLYISLVSFNNIIDYKTNFQFIHMVAKMDDTFSKEHNGWRSINSVLIHNIFFIIIISCEFLISVLLLLGTVRMISRFRSAPEEFNIAKKYTTLGLSLGVLLWFTVFIAIGGEWFLMWQSKNWNAQSTAFLLTCCFLLFLIHHKQDDK